MLHVDFQKRQCDSKLASVWIKFYVVKYVTDGSWYEAILELLHLQEQLLLIVVTTFHLLLFTEQSEIFLYLVVLQIWLAAEDCMRLS